MRRLLEKKGLGRHQHPGTRLGVLDALAFCLRTRRPLELAEPSPTPPAPAEADKKEGEETAAAPDAGGSGAPAGAAAAPPAPLSPDEPGLLPSERARRRRRLTEREHEAARRAAGKLFAEPLLDLTPNLLENVVEVVDAAHREDQTSPLALQMAAVHAARQAQLQQQGKEVAPFPPISSAQMAAQAGVGTPAALIADDRGRGRGGAYDITPRLYLEEQPRWAAHVNDVFLLGELPQPLQLRFFALRLVTAAARNRPALFFSEALAKFREKLVILCFQTITLQCDPCVDAALQCVAVMTSVSRNPPKEVLHTCLRPILKSVQDYRLLSVHALQGLLRILASLSRMTTRLFNANFPEKLLDSLRSWADPDKMIFHEDRMLVPGTNPPERLPERDRPPAWEEPEIAAALLHLFHLIQPGQEFCERFLDPRVRTTVALQAALPRYKYPRPPSHSSAPEAAATLFAALPPSMAAARQGAPQMQMQT